jgi:hypothetical protein
MKRVAFEVEGSKIDAIHYEGSNSCVVMGHGFGAVKEGLVPYAEIFNQEFGVLLFDYRHFGGSEGKPRQLINIKKQLEDWRKAIDYARGLGYGKIALWGTSFSGGHVLVTAAKVRVDAVVSQVPFVDGVACIKAAGLKNAAILTMCGIIDAVYSLFGGSYHIPIVNNPGNLAFMNTPDAIDYLKIIPPYVKWDNLTPARVALSLRNYRPIEFVKSIRCPVQYIIAERDVITPPEPALRAAEMTENAEVLKVDGGHFDVYLDLFEFCAEKEMEFLRKHLD